MKVNIPAQVIFKCDRCGAEDKRGEGSFKYGGTHGKFEMWARGYDGAAGGITRDLDLCSNCSNEFEKFLNERSKVVKE